jgi:hypothetical protein
MLKSIPVVSIEIQLKQKLDFVIFNWKSGFAAETLLAVIFKCHFRRRFQRVKIHMILSRKCHWKKIKKAGTH